MSPLKLREAVQTLTPLNLKSLQIFLVLPSKNSAETKQRDQKVC